MVSLLVPVCVCTLSSLVPTCPCSSPEFASPPAHTRTCLHLHPPRAYLPARVYLPVLVPAQTHTCPPSYLSVLSYLCTFVRMLLSLFVPARARHAMREGGGGGGGGGGGVTMAAVVSSFSSVMVVGDGEVGHTCLLAHPSPPHPYPRLSLLSAMWYAGWLWWPVVTADVRRW